MVSYRQRWDEVAKAYVIHLYEYGLFTQATKLEDVPRAAESCVSLYLQSCARKGIEPRKGSS